MWAYFSSCHSGRDHRFSVAWSNTENFVWFYFFRLLLPTSFRCWSNKNEIKIQKQHIQRMYACVCVQNITVNMNIIFFTFHVSFWRDDIMSGSVFACINVRSLAHAHLFVRSIEKVCQWFYFQIEYVLRIFRIKSCSSIRWFLCSHNFSLNKLSSFGSSSSSSAFAWLWWSFSSLLLLCKFSRFNNFLAKELNSNVKNIYFNSMRITGAINLMRNIWSSFFGTTRFWCWQFFLPLSRVMYVLCFLLFCFSCWI